MNKTTNREYLSQHVRGITYEVALPFEHEVASDRRGESSVRSLAFGAGKYLLKKLSSIDANSIRQSVEVEYPDVDEDRVTCGSEVTIRQGGAERRIYLVGFSQIFEKLQPAEMPRPVAVNSALGREIIGARVDDEMVIKSPNPKFSEVKILDIRQDIRPLGSSAQPLYPAA